MRRALAAAVVVLLAAGGQAQTLAYDGAPLREVIADVERRTDWRFLYADALVAGPHVSVRTTAEAFPDALARALDGQGVGVEADAGRRRILLVPAPRAVRPPAPPSARQRPERVVRGRVVDAETGRPLPFSTVSWAGGRRGVVADEGGAFVLTLRDREAMDATPLTASYVGYRPQSAAPRGPSVAFRLRGEAARAAPVVVDALALRTLDPAWAERVQPGRYDALAEGSGVRALDVLPAVAPSALFSEGPVVRGSPSDAFEVRLDGVPIYNPRHLFGLVDAFNGDALRVAALHVGVAPARVEVAPGGAVDYVTATGSPRVAEGRGGVSSVAARGAVSAPIRPGRTTLLIGARHSLLGLTPGSGALVEQGLGAAPNTGPLPDGTASISDRVIDVTATEARFWDLHGALDDERPGGGSTTLTAYAGGDDTRLDALRTVARTAGDGLRQQPVATGNRWGSGAASLADRRPLGDRAVLASTMGGSLYHAQFGQDDFSFFAAAPLGRVDTLGYVNDFREGVVAQRVDAVLAGGVASGGYRLHLYGQRYEETAAQRPAFVADRTARRLDLHAGWGGHLLPALDIDAGLRAHLTSVGGARLSPRLRARWTAAPGVAVVAGAGRSVQVAHRLTLGDVAGAAAWVLSTSGETITEGDLAELTVEARAGGVTASLTAYAKATRGLWLHVEGADARRITDATVLTRPWLTGVDGDARGLEALVAAPLGPWSLGASAALARADLQHPALADGAAFAATWDRRARATLLADGPLGGGVRLAASWTVASGVPNPLAGAVGEADRLAPLSRLDLRLVAQRAVGPAVLTFALAVRNATDADNVISREPTQVVKRPVADRLGVVPLDIYDAGVLPTVDLAVHW
ncbi:carboxypeptidase-like regulatory domain-containing protein [Rubrivirga sp. IMCC43871]|uniref:carboxypeptidase-like regulatory domain-containing protein n=1 Tax=Rubrivirga sp. IMCC43871 TaxID=3391575 RepID=UPI0039901D48